MPLNEPPILSTSPDAPDPPPRPRPPAIATIISGRWSAEIRVPERGTSAAVLQIVDDRQCRRGHLALRIGEMRELAKELLRVADDLEGARRETSEPGPAHVPGVPMGGKRVAP